MKRLLERMGDSVKWIVRKVVSGFVKMTEALKQALTLGETARNLGITNQTVTTVASAVVPVVLPPGTTESMGAAAHHTTLAILHALSQHGVPVVGSIAFKLSLVPTALVGSTLATFGFSVLLLSGLWLCGRCNRRLGLFADFVADVRDGWEWFCSIFSPRAAQHPFFRSHRSFAGRNAAAAALSFSCHCPLATIHSSGVSLGKEILVANLDWSQCHAVESVPGKLGGAWVFRDTRLPISVVFKNLEAGATIDEITEWFHIDKERVVQVLEFAAESAQAPRVVVET